MYVGARAGQLDYKDQYVIASNPDIISLPKHDLCGTERSIRFHVWHDWGKKGMALSKRNE